MTKFWIFALIISIILNLSQSSIDLKTAEKILIENLENYIEIFEDQIFSLKGHLNEYQQEHAEALEDSEKYLSNPINAYLLTKRLTIDWKHVQTIMVNKIGADIVNNITNFENEYGKIPSENDLKEAVMDLVRLQETYKLGISEIADGRLDDIQYGHSLKSAECFEIGRQLQKINNFDLSLEWLKESLKRYRHEVSKGIKTVLSESQILEFVSWSFYNLRNFGAAIKIAKQSLKLNSDNYDLVQNLRIYKGDLKRSKLGQKLRVYKHYFKSENEILFEKACRGQLLKSSAEYSRLYCWYSYGHHPFTILAPLKFEELNLEPQIVQFHDVLSENEIYLIRNYSNPLLIRSTASNSTFNNSTKSHHSYYGHLRYKNEFLTKLSKRLETMVGLNLTISDTFTVEKHDIGGHYLPRHDYFSTEAMARKMVYGDRLATFEIHISDVTKGGATVFPMVETIIEPKRGSAIFWFNLLEDGQSDVRTIHGSCPVIIGTKWVLNKRIRQRGQISYK